MYYIVIIHKRLKEEYNVKNKEVFMEIVKPLKGPDEEEVEESFNFDFEEHFLEESEEERKRSKGFLFTTIGLITVSILGYIGFKSLQPSNTSTVPVTLLTDNNQSKPTIKKETIAKTPKEQPVGKEVITKPKEVIKKPQIPIVSVKEEITKVVRYTEELALEHVAKLEPKIIKPKIQKKSVIQTITEIKSTPPLLKEEKIVTKTIKKKVKKVSPKAKTIRKKPRIAIVKKGDTLALLSEKFYGNPMEFKRIIRANKSIKSHKTRLKVGQKVIIPYLPKNKRRRYITVKKGYNLAYISKKFYGTTTKIDKIVAANYNIKNKNTPLRIGQKVYVPK